MDGHFIGPDTSPDITKGCQRLAQVCKTTLLGIQFDTKSADNWVFRDATPLPDLSTGGKELLELLAVFLKRELGDK